MRSLIFELRPAEVDREGLVATLRKHLDVLRRVYPTTIDLSVSGETPLAPEVERELFRIQLEALSNALKHAGALRVSVEMRYDPEAVRIRVSDDGKGFDPAAAGIGSRRLGLTSMRERVAGLGGMLSIDSGPGRGTTVAVEVPRGR
jgi:signal transduction histidine kinase